MDGAAERPRRDRRAAIALGGLLLAGVVLRLLGAWWYRHDINPDYAIIVHMARHTAAGLGWPVFFYGQAYMGSLEPTLSALLVWLFGPSPFVVCLGTALFAVGLLVAVARWADELGGRRAAVAALALAVVGPSGYVHYMASPRGGYALGLLLTVLLLREGAGMAHQAAGRERSPPSPGRCAWLGLLGGLAFWNFWLVLPAVGAAGLVLWTGLGRRLFRPRVWLPGAAGFLAGSLPFWRWNAQNGWRSLAAETSGAGRGQVVTAAWRLVTERLPILLNAGPRTPRGQALLTLAAYALPFAAGVWTMAAAWRRRGTARGLPGWAGLALVLYGALYGLCYAVSSFSIPTTPRYLLPFVPLWAVVAGCGLAAAWTAATDPTRSAPPRQDRGRQAVAIVLSLAALMVLGLQIRLLPIHWRRGQAWHDAAVELGERLPGQGIDSGYGDYLLQGINWATDERFVISSPLMERHLPYRQRLEQTDQPAVLENFRGFSHFVESTRGSVTYERVGRFRLHTQAEPPRERVSELDPARIASIVDDRGQDVRTWMVDQIDSTQANFSTLVGRERWFEVSFDEPVDLCGVTVWPHDQETFAEWSIEGRASEEDPFEVLSEPRVATGYFWSGPRFYWGGPLWRMEKRFAPRRLSALRLRMELRSPTASAQFEGLTFWQPTGETLVEWPRVELWVPLFRERGVRRVYADRWAANALHEASEGQLWTSREPRAFPANGDPTRPRLASDVAILVEPAAVPAVRRAFAMMRFEGFEELEHAGLHGFLFSEVPPAHRAYEGLRFGGTTLSHGCGHRLATLLDELGEGGQADRVRASALDHEHPTLPLRAAFFEGGLTLLGLSDWPDQIHPGDLFTFDAFWNVEPGFEPPRSLFVFVHFVRDGRILFQVDEPLQPRARFEDALVRPAWRSHHTVQVPATIEQGPLTPLVGLSVPGVIGRRMPVETEHPVARRRVTIEAPLEVVP